MREDDAIEDRTDEVSRQEEDLEIFRALLVFVAFTNSSLVFAQANSRQLLPTIEIGSVKTDIFGWSWSTYNSNTDEISHNLLRVRGIITDEASPWGGFFDLQLKDPGDRETNPLQELRISYDVSAVAVLFGRMDFVLSVGGRVSH